MRGARAGRARARIAARMARRVVVCAGPLGLLRLADGQAGDAGHDEQAADDLGMPMRSSNSQYDSASTERISRCDAAKAGPMGARLSKVIHEKKAPM